ncbi:MAG: hypothetical protein J6R67_09855 [Treponema sp.]|nr:hypothetical protein [Treponema sp.]
MRLAKVAQYIATFRLAAVAPYPRTLEENACVPAPSTQQYSPMNEKLGGGCQRVPTDAEL